MADNTGSPRLSIGAFQRLRIAEPETLFTSKLCYDNQALLWDDAQVSGAGTTSTHTANRASVALAVANVTAGKRVRQTKFWPSYQPGKSQEIMITSVLGTGAAGITREVGLFNNDNGLFFRLSGTTLSVVRRTKVSGSVVDTVVDQSSWNIDKLDGTGFSKITVDTSKAQVFIIEFSWLGSGRAVLGMFFDGRVHYCHEFLAANTLTSVYMSTPNLPVRYSIENSGAGAVAELECICAAVASEGGQEKIGVVRSANNGNTAVVAALAGTLYACLGIKYKAAYVGAFVQLIRIALIGTTTNDNMRWELYQNPTVAGTFTYGDVADSAVQTATGATTNTVSGGTLLASGYAIGQSHVVQTIEGNVLVRLGSKIDGTSDTLVLAVSPVGAAVNLNIYGAMVWHEV